MIETATWLAGSVGRWIAAVVVPAILLAFSLPCDLLADPTSDATTGRTLAHGKEWAVSVTPYAWLTGFAVNADGVAIRRGFTEMASMTNSGGMLRIGGYWRKLYASLDWIYANLGGDERVGPLEMHLDLTQRIVTPKVGAVLLDTHEPGRVEGTQLRGFIGARYWSLDPTVSFTYYPIQGGDPESDQASFPDSWWDPLIGAAANFDVTEVVHFITIGSVGGFEIGDASDYTWDFGAFASFKVWQYLAVHAGYQVLQYKRTSGESTSKLTMNGPLLGLSLFY